MDDFYGFAQGKFVFNEMLAQDATCNFPSLTFSKKMFSYGAVTGKIKGALFEFLQKEIEIAFMCLCNNGYRVDDAFFQIRLITMVTQGKRKNDRQKDDADANDGLCF